MRLFFGHISQGFADLIVFVITNDLSKEYLGSGTILGDTSDASLPQANKPLRDEVLHYVTTGVRRAAQAADRCVGSPEQQVLDIDPLLLTNDSGTHFEAFKDMLLQMLVGGIRGANGRGNNNNIPANLRTSVGAQAVVRMHMPPRRALFESENERLVAEEIMAAFDHRDDIEKSHSVSSGTSSGTGLKRVSRTTSQASSSRLTMRTSISNSRSSISSSHNPASVSSHDGDTLERSVGSSTISRNSTLRSTVDNGYEPLTTSLLPHSTDNSSPPFMPQSSFLPTIHDHNSTERLTTSNGNESISSNEVKNKTTFIDYLPAEFAQIRKHFKIDTSTFVDEWSTAAKVKLNEGGASQAFFFYSGGERFIAKSCTLVNIWSCVYGDMFSVCLYGIYIYICEKE
jgi:hypothetical protein